MEATLDSLGFSILDLCLFPLTDLPHFYCCVSAITQQALAKGCNLHPLLKNNVLVTALLFQAIQVEVLQMTSKPKKNKLLYSLW